MLKKFLLDILIDPVSKKQLFYNEVENVLFADKEHYFKVEEDVAIVLVDNQSNQQSPLHQAEKTSFNYVEHYKNDADINNYFAPNETITTKNERKRNREAIVSKVEKNTKLILDVGCGEAWVAKHFTNKNIHVVSMDVAPQNPIQALKNIHNEHHAAVVADVFNPPFAVNSFDVIIASEIIEHLYDPKIFIQKLLPLLTKNGKLIIVTPYNEKLTYHTCVHCNHPTPSNAHLYSFNKKNFKSYLPANIHKIQYSILNNKYFTKLKLYNIINFLPYQIWQKIDRVVNKIIGKESVFLIEIYKPI